MTQAQLRLALIEAGINPQKILLQSDSYDQVSPAFFAQAWAASVAALPAELKTTIQVGGGMTAQVPLYLPEVWNCDKITGWTISYVELCAAEAAAKTGVARYAVGAGALNYDIGANAADGHEICWYWDYSGVIHFFEPQTGSEVTLTAAELATVTLSEAK